MRKVSVIVVGLVVALHAVASDAQAQGQRVWVDVNVGVAVPGEGEYDAAASLPLFSEVARFAADYDFPVGANVDVGGGFLFTPQFGAGISLTGTAHRGPATVSATIPHPGFFNASATGVDETSDDLERTEGAIHFQGVFVVPTSDRLQLRFFGGPSYFQVTQDTVDDIRFRQTFGTVANANSVTITDVDLIESEGSAWGFHLGGDVSYFFNRVVGLGGFVRYSRAEVELDDLGGDVRKSTAGGVQAGIGLRLRF